MELDENSAKYVPPDIGTICYHCPSTTCDGHLYISAGEMGRELRCPKCKLIVTIGSQKMISAAPEPMKAPLPEHIPSWSKLLLVALGIVIGLLLAWASTHF